MIHKRKSAFTLLELVISMAVISFILSLGITGTKVAKKTMNNIRGNAAISDLSSFLSYCKLYCDKNNVSVIIFCRNNGNMEFNDVKNNFIKRITLPRGFRFITNYSINCNNEGTLSPGSIYIENNDGEFYKVTISVGIDNINVYYEE